MFRRYSPRRSREKKVVDRLLYTDPVTKEKIVHERDIPFYKYQERLVFGSNGSVDPKNIDDYLAIGGYAALAKALSGMTSDQVLQEVKKANLRGRGGGGFPAGRKWEGSRNAPGDIKYVIVNADEGDPGAYMDRSLLEGNPHAVLEGLTIGAYAIGAHEGYIYVRQEYPLAVENVFIAIRQAEEYGLLGENILGTGFDFKVIVHQGAGAFVCGESTALMTALEGRAGEPRPKYIRSNIVGLWGRPSVLNNVETWANVPLIINKGRGLVYPIRNGEQQGHEDFLPGRQDHQYRPGGSAHGHAPAGHYLQDRRRHPRRQEIQGRADRGPVRRLHPGAPPGSTGRVSMN